MTGRRRQRSGRVALVVAAALTTGAAGTLAAGVTVAPWRSGPPTDTGGKLPPGTGKVTRQTLVDTRTEDGTLGYGSATTLPGRLSGTVTALPAVGTTVRRGQPIYRVDDTPVVLLYGPLPAYRALSPGTKGADVRQFEENLYALGHRGFTVDTKYTAKTAKAVKAWQEDLGLQETGTVELGRVVYVAGPVRVDSHKAAAGDRAESGKAPLSYTGGTRIVTVELDMSDRPLAVVGATVRVRLPAGGSARGKITAVRTVIETDDQGGDSGAAADDQTKTVLEVHVTVDDDKALSGLDQASLEVEFTASQRKNVLTVPVAALLALSEGGYGLQVVQGTTARIVKVQTGLFATGRVEVFGRGIAAGMTVGMPT